MENKLLTGIGFRREIADYFFQNSNFLPDFVEVAPENWIDMGGYWKDVFNKVAEKYYMIFHGLSLSIGSPEEPDWKFLTKVKNFIKEYDIRIYSEHLSFAKFENAHLYDLLPIPFRNDSINHIVNRIDQVQNFLEMQIILENVSYYTPVAAEMTEYQFINEIVQRSGCGLLLDVNNVYVNAFNHNYNAEEFIDKISLDSVKYIHMAGHLQVDEDLIIDTHGEPVIDEVYNLFDYTLEKMQRNVPVLLERDFNFPELNELQEELTRLKNIMIKNNAHVVHA